MTTFAPQPGGSLAELQRAFQAWILDGTPAIETSIAATAALPVERRLRVYGAGYRIRLLGVLASDYAKLCAWVGKETFDRWGLAYLDAHPSSHPSLRWLGRELVAFLGERDDSDACHSEMAHFEWVQGEVFDGPSGGCVTLEEVAAVPPERWSAMRFTPHATVRLLELEWNVPAIWRDLENEEEARDPVRATAPVAWVLWRRDLQVHWRSLAAEEEGALRVLVAGGDFGAICETLLAWNEEDDVPARAAGFLKSWIAEGLLGSLQRDDMGRHSP